MFDKWRKTVMVKPEDALKGRAEAMRVASKHLVLGTPMVPPFPAHLHTAVFGLGCFWGAERKFWQTQGVYSTAVGYAADSPRTRPTKKSARASRAMPKSCWWSSIQPSCRSIGCCRSSGKAMIRRRA